MCVKNNNSLTSTIKILINGQKSVERMVQDMDIKDFEVEKVKVLTQRRQLQEYIDNHRNGYI